MKRVLAALALALGTSVAAPVMAQDVVGEVVTVTSGARLERDGRVFALAPKVSVLSGDAITTNGTGTVQLVFRDKTRVVVGPDSEFVAADIEFARNGRARNFAVNTVGGTFRFLSGDSAKRVYSISTPTTTMGIRGTTFDFATERSTNTTLVTFSGEVQMCGAGRRCYAISGSCATIRAGRRGVDPDPVEMDDKVALLRRQFPFTQSQRSLGSGFRASLVGCGPNDSDEPGFRAARVRRVASPPPGEVVTPALPTGSDSSGSSPSSGGGGGSSGGGPRSGP